MGNITVIIAVVGWGMVHFLSSVRDRYNKKRDIQIQYLIDAYRSIEHAGNRPLLKQSADALEAAIADIQLFGSKEQVRLAWEFAKGFSGSRSASLDPLLESLRKDLRHELRIEEITEPLKYLRISPPTDKHEV